MTREAALEEARRLHREGVFLPDPGREGDPAERRERAVDLLRQARDAFRRLGCAAEEAAVLSDLGVAWLQRPGGSRGENVERAIQAMEESLAVRSQETALKDWALTAGNLSVAYRMRPRGDPTENLRQAIRILEEILEAILPADHPNLWAQTHHRLGDCFQKLPTGDHSEQLERAIQHYRQALEIRQERGRRSQANTLVNLSFACYRRQEGDPAVNQETALEYARQALDSFTATESPAEWISLRMLMGNLMEARLRGDRDRNLEQAIRHYREALQVAGLTEWPRQHGQLNNNLGRCHLNRQRGRPEGNLDEAVRCFTRALEGQDREDDPVEWARSHRNLAEAHRGRIPFAGEPAWRACLRHADQAARVYRPDRYPMEAALIEVDRAEAHRRRPDSGVPELVRALEHYRRALSGETLAAEPGTLQRAALGAGECLLELGRESEARPILEQAVDAFEHRYRLRITPEGRRAALERGAPIHSLAALAAAATGDRAGAAEHLARGKARMLSDRLRLDRIRLQGLHRVQRDRYRQITRRLLDQEDRIRQTGSGAELARQAGEADELRIELTELIREVRRENPRFLEPVRDLAELRSGLPHRSLLLDLGVTAQGSLAVIVPGPGLRAEPMDWIQPGFTTADLGRLRARWLREHWLLRAHPRDPAIRADWERTVTDTLAELEERFLGPALQAIRRLRPDRLLISPHRSLALWPLHLVRPGGGSRLLLEEMELAYLPGGGLVEHLRAAGAPGEPQPLVVADPGGDLEWAASEARVLRESVPATRTLTGTSATPAALVREAVGCTHLHLACHGRFELDSPESSWLLLSDGKAIQAESAGVRSLFLPARADPPGVRWTAGEIVDQLRLDSRPLVVLSACESGLVGDSGEADEFLGLPAAFLQAGAAAVASSLWLVDDRATRVLMERFYRSHLAAGRSVPAALREAQLSLMREGAPLFEWGAFAVWGG